MNTTLDWQDIPLSYALVADPKHRIINADDVMDNSTVILVGSWNDCNRCETEMVAAAYQRQVDRFEQAYDDHISELCSDPWG